MTYKGLKDILSHKKGLRKQDVERIVTESGVLIGEAWNLVNALQA